MEDHKAIIDAVINLFQRVAEKTENTWDNNLSNSLRSLFDTLLGPVRFGASPEHAKVGQVQGMAEIPIWALPVALEVISLVRRLLSNHPRP